MGPHHQHSIPEQWHPHHVRHLHYNTRKLYRQRLPGSTQRRTTLATSRTRLHRSEYCCIRVNVWKTTNYFHKSNPVKRARYAYLKGTAWSYVERQWLFWARGLALRLCSFSYYSPDCHLSGQHRPREWWVLPGTEPMSRERGEAILSFRRVMEDS